MRQRLSGLSTLLLAAVVLLGALNLIQIARQIHESRLEFTNQAPMVAQDSFKPKVNAPFHLVVVYSYFLNETLLEEDTKNLNFFLKLGVYQNVDSVDYFFLVASEAPKEREAQAKQLFAQVSNASNVHVKQIDNSGIYDLCNYLRLISSPEFDNLTRKKNTTHVFFINATLRGPFVPLYVAPEPWWNPFLRQLAASPHTVLVGSYMSCEVKPHIQTMNLFMDMRGVGVAKSHWQCPSEQIKTNWDMRKKWIIDNEVGLSTKILQSGFTFRTMMTPRYFGNGQAPVNCDLNNPTYESFFHQGGSHASPYDVIFFKCAGEVLRINTMPRAAHAMLESVTNAHLQAVANRGNLPRDILWPGEEISLA